MLLIYGPYVGWGYWTLYFLSSMVALEYRAHCLGLETIIYSKEVNRSWIGIHIGRDISECMQQASRKKLSKKEWPWGLGIGGMSMDVLASRAQIPTAPITVVCTPAPAQDQGVCISESWPVGPMHKHLQGQSASRSLHAAPAHCEVSVNVREEQQTDFPKANYSLHFLNECKCACMGNFSKFIRIWWLDQRSIKLVSRHKELFRKWLTFRAAPKKDKDFVYSMRPLE